MEKLFSSLLSMLCLTAACSAGDDGRTLSPREFDKAVTADTTAYIIDVRRASEFAEGHLRNAHSLDVLSQDAFADGIRLLDKSRTYYIYCRSGRRSQEAYRLMSAEGLNVYDMKGGINAWMGEGLPLVK